MEDHHEQPSSATLAAARAVEESALKEIEKNLHKVPHFAPASSIKAVKADHGKPRISLVPPAGIIAAARAMTYGAIKYKEFNFLAGDMKLLRLVDAMCRHILAWEMREERDQESGLLHTDHIAACALMLAELAESGLGIDDRQPKSGNHDLGHG